MFAQTWAIPAFNCDEKHREKLRLHDAVEGNVLLAGYDTSAVTMTWALYLIAQHPQVGLFIQLPYQRPPPWDWAIPQL